MLATEAGALGRVDVDGDTAMVVNLFHRACERRYHRTHIGDGTDRGDARGEPRALEMARDLVAHDLGLLAHLQGERIAAMTCGLVHHDRDRRLQCMCEVADMGARACHDFTIGVDERIGFARKRRDLDREGAFEPFRRTRADGGEALGDTFERRQAETNLEGGGQQQHNT